MKVHNPNSLPVAAIADLLPTQGELKDLSETNYNKLKNNIVRRGFIDPVSVWEDSKGLKHLLNGHQRQRVLTKENWNEPIPYFNIPAKDLQEAAAIVLELTSQYGTITQEGLDSHIAKYELSEQEVYESTSFDGLGKYGDEEEVEIEEDEAPEVSSEPPVSKLGVVYQLGRHRVMCGDSTDKASVDTLMDGVKADMLLTDPPYGIDYGSQLIKGEEFKDKTNKHGWRNFGSPEWDKRLEIGSIKNILSYSVDAIVWGGNYFADELPASQGWLVWDKGQRKFSLADGEMAWTSFDNAMRIKSYARATANQEEKVHATQKPQEIIIWCIEYADRHSKNKPKTFLDLFLGSGSTLIACEQTDRICYGMELDPKYTDVIRKRYAKFISPDDQLPENWEELTPVMKALG